MSIREDAIMMLLSGEGGSADVAELTVDANGTYEAVNYTNVDGVATLITDPDTEKPLDGFDPVNVNIDLEAEYQRGYKDGQQDPDQKAAYDKWCKHLIEIMFPEAKQGEIPEDEEGDRGSFTMASDLPNPPNQEIEGGGVALFTALTSLENVGTVSVSVEAFDHDHRRFQPGEPGWHGENDGNLLRLALKINGEAIRYSEWMGQYGFWYHYTNEFQGLTLRYIDNPPGYADFYELSAHIVTRGQDGEVKYEYDGKTRVQAPSGTEKAGYSTIVS